MQIDSFNNIRKALLNVLLFKQEGLAKKTQTLKEELDRWNGYLGQVLLINSNLFP